MPPNADGEFVAQMEEVLEVDDQASDLACPGGMDEQSVQLFGETRGLIAATPEHAERGDYEYERPATARIAATKINAPLMDNSPARM